MSKLSFLASPTAKSVALHLLVVLLLVTSVDVSSPSKPKELNAVQPIKAVVIDQQVIEQRQQAKRDKRAEQQRAAQAEQQRRKKLEEEKRARAEAQRKKKLEQEQARKREEERKKQQAEEQRLERERLAREQREREEAERKRQEERERQEQQRIMQEQLAVERAEQAQRRQKHVLSEKDKYEALIYQAIKNKLITDDSMDGKSCKINILLATTGFVVRVKVLGGDTIVCRAAENAVLKAGKLPVSPEPDVYREIKDITFIFDL